jgi:hypothetical protein
MSVRFIGIKLVNEEGNNLRYSFKKLRNACLCSSYKSVRIFDIVSEGVKEVTNYNLTRYGIRDSPVFSELEKAILKDSRYQARREEILKKELLERKKREQSRLPYIGIGEYYNRKRLLKYYYRKYACFREH